MSRKQSQIVALAQLYYVHLDRAQAEMELAKTHKERLLAITDPGRYGRYIIYEVGEKEIKVKAHVRKAFRAIRRSKQSY